MVLTVHIDIVQAIVEGAAAGYAFRASECAEEWERARTVMEAYEAAAREFSHTVMAELSGCGGSCGPCQHQCALGRELLTAHWRWYGIRRRVDGARSQRRRARTDTTRLRALRRRESMARRLCDAAGLGRARRAADSVAARWYGHWWSLSWGNTGRGRWGTVPTNTEFRVVVNSEKGER